MFSIRLRRLVRRLAWNHVWTCLTASLPAGSHRMADCGSKGSAACPDEAQGRCGRAPQDTNSYRETSPSDARFIASRTFVRSQKFCGVARTQCAALLAQLMMDGSGNLLPVRRERRRCRQSAFGFLTRDCNSRGRNFWLSRFPLFQKSGERRGVEMAHVRELFVLGVGYLAIAVQHG